MIDMDGAFGKATAESIFNLRFKPQRVMHIPDNDVKIEKTSSASCEKRQVLLKGQLSSKIFYSK